MSYSLYLPSVHSRPEQSYARRLAMLIKADPRQQRQELVADERLFAAAETKVQALAELGRLSHTVGGVSANGNVIAHGFPLPDWYHSGPDANNVESLAARQEFPREALEAWWLSPDHRAHVFGQSEFYRDQTRIGVGHSAKQADNGAAYWWCVLIAHDTAL